MPVEPTRQHQTCTKRKQLRDRQEYYKYKICSEMHNAYHNREGNRRARSTTVASEQATTTKHTVNLLQTEEIKLRLQEARA